MACLAIARDETYGDIEKMIYNICWKMQRKFGGDVEEYVSVANEAFAEKQDRYDPSRGAFTTFIWVVVRNAIRTWLGKERKSRMFFVEELDVDSSTEGHGVPFPFRSRFDIEDFYRTASEDAVEVVKMIMQSPIEIMDAITVTERGRTSVRQSIRQYYRNLGWGVMRIAEAFNEIKESLR